MEQERNYGVPYPIYPNYQGMMMPGMMPNMIPSMETNINTCSDNSNLETKINSLEKRVSNIENYLNNNGINNYNNSNYQML